MIQSNSAMYLGILTACVLERCPAATVIVTRESGGYEIRGSVKYGPGKGEGSAFQSHRFLDAETVGIREVDLRMAARISGDDKGAALASVA